MVPCLNLLKATDVNWCLLSQHTLELRTYQREPGGSGSDTLLFGLAVTRQSLIMIPHLESVRPQQKHSRSTGWLEKWTCGTATDTVCTPHSPSFLFFAPLK
jgi:hypothetical protein